MNAERHNIDVCTDCYYVNANGFGDLDLTPEREEEIATGLEYYEGQYILDNLYTTPHFVMGGAFNRCGVCGSTLGGDRYQLCAVEL